MAGSGIGNVYAALRSVAAGVGLAFALVPFAHAELRAGTSRLDIPPSTAILEATFETVRDPVNVRANISTSLGLRLRAASPLTRTILVSLNYGPMRYVTLDQDYVLNTYESTVSTAKFRIC